MKKKKKQTTIIKKRSSQNWISFPIDNINGREVAQDPCN